MAEAMNLAALLAAGADDEPALLAPGRPTLSHGRRRGLAAATAARLNDLGIGRGDVVAIVLDNGPAMATTFLAAAAAAAAAPLNPAYTADELAFYLDDLGARAVLVRAGDDGPARRVARARGIAVIELTESPADPAGLFTLGGVHAPANRPGPGEADDVALILHTSGTTSRPKMVPLTQRNLAASARNVVATLGLGPADRCLQVMPLFHIHGLVATLLAPLAAGGSVACSGGFNALRFFAQLDQLRPTWCSAVPTMHQAVLARADRNREVLGRCRLRFLRSSSASLPPQVMAALEAAFGCPVIESYGMTEAAHQMTSNPLPPAPRKPGTVGVAAGPEVAIMDGAGVLLPAGSRGEVVIRGDSVTGGYAANPDANAKAFTSGWFRTGDEGVLDDDGYLTITGRLKEIINRGGEKVSPLEVDEVLMDHPAIAQVVTFAMPHAKLGEEVACAVVLREGMVVVEQEIRSFASGRLADFKVPRRVVILEEIPKGATGKLQRIGLAAKLGLGA
ncbi:MAG: acyl--CoA ligase [Alphaproteobacteria bacterium]